MRVSEAVVDALVDGGVDTVFGIPGTQSLPLNEAMDGRADVRFVMARHETAVPHQAWGYAESSGRPAATVVIPGPGDMNSMNGLKNALNHCVPLVHIAVETEPDLRGGDAIHETPPETYDTVVKENLTVPRPSSAAATVSRAIAVAQTPPKGPVRVGIPRDFLPTEATQVGTAEFDRSSVAGVPEDEVAAAATLLSTAEAPFVLAGGGVRASEAADELRAVAEALDAPVVTTYKGKGLIPEDHDLFAGILSVGSSEHLYDLIADSDAALAVGTDFDAVTTQEWSPAVPEALVHVTLDPDDLGRGYDPQIGLVADAREALSALAGRLEPRPAGEGSARARAVREADRDLMDDVLDVSDPPLTSASAETALRAALPDDAIVAVDAGGFRIWSLYALPVYGPRQFVDTGSWATMGTALPAAIGARLANPETPVVALVGDGGLLMAMQELHTAACEDVPVIVVVLNNDDYATISAEAAASFDFEPGPYGWPEVPVSFTDVARGLGVEATRAETPAEIETAVGDAIAADEPVLVEVPTDPFEPQAKPLD